MTQGTIRIEARARLAKAIAKHVQRMAHVLSDRAKPVEAQACPEPGRGAEAPVRKSRAPAEEDMTMEEAKAA
jgi:hypothetical protein